MTEQTARTAGSRRTPPRLRGYSLILARLAWVAVTLLVVVIFIVGEFLYVAELQTVCTKGAEACLKEGLLTPENVQQLRALGLSVPFYAAYDAIINTIFVSVWLAVGALIFWRRSDDRIALLVSLFLTTYGPMSFGPIGPEFLVAEYPALWLPVNGLQFLGEVGLALFFCLFPSGRFVPHWSRWLALAYLALVAPPDLFPGSPLDWVSRFDLSWPVAFAPFFIGFVTMQVYRYRWVSGPVERQQTKWVVFGTTATFAGFLGVVVFATILDLPDESSITFYYFAIWTVSYGFMLLIPLSISMAMLRSRLFDVDVLINRTLVYGLLTATLVVVYVGGVVLLQTLFRALTGGTHQLAIVASTLAIAVLFNPLRHRVQILIDRRFYRKKYDAAKTLEAFSARLRDETDLDALTEDLIAAVRTTLEPAQVSVWLRESGSAAAQTEAR